VRALLQVTGLVDDRDVVGAEVVNDEAAQVIADGAPGRRPGDVVVRPPFGESGRSRHSVLP
jgi:hypothetical protein